MTVTRRQFLNIGAGAIAATAASSAFPRVSSATPSQYRVAWSRYVGWEPWGYMKSFGVMDKWAKKYGVSIGIQYVDDYMASVTQYAQGAFQGVAVTNMDALTVPAVGGVDTTALIVGDFSNGNDGIVVRNGGSVRDLKGRKVYILELSVSHYLLARALEMNKMSERDMKLADTSDRVIQQAYLNDGDPKAAVVTWNPMLMNIRTLDKRGTMVFDSSQTPGEIIDMLVVKTDTPDAVKKALVGAWYEAMSVMYGSGPKTTEALSYMSQESGATLAQFKAQLKTTAMFSRPVDGWMFTNSDLLKKTMEYVRTFSFDHGMYKGKSRDHVGMEFPGGTKLGDPKNVKLRFDSRYMQMAAEGKL